MSKYIPADKLIAEIERLKKNLPFGGSAGQLTMECNCKNEAYNEVLAFIESLEKERKSNEGSKMVLSDATEKLWQSIPHRTHAIYDRIKAYGLFCYEQGRKHTTCLESQGLDEAAEEYGLKEAHGENNHVAAYHRYGFKAGAEWIARQFVWVGGEPTGWFRANDGSEYATGLDLKEPIKLPADFYVRKK